MVKQLNLTSEIREYMLTEMMKIHSEAYNKGAISGLEMIKKFVNTGENVTVENIMQACDIYMEEISRM
jgi:hypothetical protein